MATEENTAPETTAVEVSDETIKSALAELLQKADFETTTEKQLRKQLEQQLGVNLSDKKAMIRAEVDAFLAAQSPAVEEQEDVENGGEEEDAEEEEEEEKPKKQKRKRKPAFGNSVLSPELAAFLGTDSMPRTQVVKAIWAYIKENNLQNPRNKQKIIVDEKLGTLFTSPLTMFSMNKQLSKHVKSSADVASRATEEDDDDDEDQDDDEEEEEEDAPKARKPAKKRAKKEKGDGETKRNGFTKPVKVSEQLAEFLGNTGEPVSRPELTKKFWNYFKTNGLQDPSDKRFIKCDQKLKDLFGVDSFQGFGLQKLLANHINKD